MNAVNVEVLLLILLVSFSAAHAYKPECSKLFASVTRLRGGVTFFSPHWAYYSLIRHDMSASF